MKTQANKFTGLWIQVAYFGCQFAGRRQSQSTPDTYKQKINIR